MFIRLVAFSCILVSTISCSEKQAVSESAVQEEPIKDIRETDDAPATETLTIEEVELEPERVHYSILSDESLRTVKRSVDVRLNEPVNRNQLAHVAHEIYSKFEGYDRTFIIYYLPGMQIGAGAWATTHFNPDLKITILGLSPDDEVVSTDNNDNFDGEAMGSWLDQGLGIKYTLIKRNGEFVFKRRFKDGAEHEFKVVPVGSSPNPNRFNVTKSRSGDYFQIDKNGNLGSFDSDGLINTLVRQ